MREPARWDGRTIATVAAVAPDDRGGPGRRERPSPPAVRGLQQQRPGGPACQDLRAGAMVACLHGNDAPPQGVSLYERPTLQELEARSSLHSPDPRLRGLAGLEPATSPSTPGAEPASVSCIGDGSSGNRIQAIYAHGDRSLSSAVGSIRRTPRSWRRP